jgi:hypothetical protein
MIYNATIFALFVMHTFCTLNYCRVQGFCLAGLAGEVFPFRLVDIQHSCRSIGGTNV